MMPNLSDTPELRTQLDSLLPARASEIVICPDAGHAFHADYRPSYQKAAAEDGWARLLAWFARHLA